MVDTGIPKLGGANMTGQYEYTRKELARIRDEMFERSFEVRDWFQMDNHRQDRSELQDYFTHDPTAPTGVSHRTDPRAPWGLEDGGRHVRPTERAIRATRRALSA